MLIACIVLSTQNYPMTSVFKDINYAQIESKCQGEQCDNGAAPVAKQPNIAQHIAAEKLALKQQKTQLKKDIAQLRNDIFKTIGQIAQGNMSDEVKLLQNILNHERQSLESLMKHKMTKRPLRQPPFPGCPLCG